MEITEVRIKLMNSRDEKLKAFCTITFNDEFVVRDIKIIEGTKGPFVAMPSRKVTDHCSRCGGKNHVRARFCNDCGAKLDSERIRRYGQGRARLHTDIAHPINAECRRKIQSSVIKAYEEEWERSRSPDYVPVDFDDDLSRKGENPGPAGKKIPLEKDRKEREEGFSRPPYKAGRPARERGDRGASGSLDAGAVS